MAVKKTYLARASKLGRPLARSVSSEISGPKLDVGEAPAQPFGLFADLLFADDEQLAVFDRLGDLVEIGLLEPRDSLGLGDQIGRLLELGPGDRLAEQFFALRALELVALDDPTHPLGGQRCRRSLRIRRG